MAPREIGMCVRPGAIGKNDNPVDMATYYRPFLYGAPSRMGRMGRMGRGFGIGGGGKKGWGMRWIKGIFGKHKNN